MPDSDTTKPMDEEGKLHIVDGKGTSRSSWGAPSVRTTIRRLTETAFQVEVVGWHKHTVSPVGGTYYFLVEDQEWVRRTKRHHRVKSALTTSEAKFPDSEEPEGDSAVVQKSGFTSPECRV